MTGSETYWVQYIKMTRRYGNKETSCHTVFQDGLIHIQRKTLLSQHCIIYFRWASFLGKLLTELAIDGKTCHDITRWTNTHTEKDFVVSTLYYLFQVGILESKYGVLGTITTRWLLGGAMVGVP